MAHRSRATSLRRASQSAAASRALSVPSASSCRTVVRSKVTFLIGRCRSTRTLSLKDRRGELRIQRGHRRASTPKARRKKTCRARRRPRYHSSRRSTLPMVLPDASRSRHVAFEAKSENLIGDRAYDSDPPDEELRRDGIEMIAPDRANRSKPPTQDRRRLTRYMRRWLVERFFAWIQWQRWNPRPLGVLYPEFPGLCSTRLPRYPLQAILRQVLSKN